MLFAHLQPWPKSFLKISRARTRIFKLYFRLNFRIPGLIAEYPNAVVTPLRKAASYEPRIAIFGIWCDTWLNRGKYGIYVVVTGPYGVYVTPSGKFCHVKSALFTVVSPTYVAVTRIPSLVLRNTWHYVIIRCQNFLFPKFVLRCSYEAALRKGVTTA